MRLIYIVLTFLILPQSLRAIDVPIIKPGSFIELESFQSRDRDYTIQFFENNKCSYSYWDLWTTTSTNCSWQQEGPEVTIQIGKGGFKGNFSGGNYPSYLKVYAGTFEYTGFLKNYTHIWKDWKSPEERELEKKRLAEQERLRKLAEERELEKKRLAEIERNKNLYSTNSTNQSGGREYAKQVASYKAGVAMKGFLGGLIGLAIGFGLYSIMDRKIKNKLNDKFFLGAAFFIGWIITKFI